MKETRDKGRILSINCSAPELIKTLESLEGTRILSVIPSKFSLKDGTVLFYRILFRFRDETITSFGTVTSQVTAEKKDSEG